MSEQSRRGDFREHDIRALKALLADPDRLSREGEFEAFDSMLDGLEREGGFPDLTAKQRAWVTHRCAQLDIEFDAPVDNSAVPRGREVVPPAILNKKNLPLCPPRTKVRADR